MPTDSEIPETAPGPLKEFPCFTTGENAEPITLERTLELEDEW